MPTVKIKIDVEVDGQSVVGFPVVRRLEPDEVQQFDYEQADHGDAVTFSEIPADILDTIQALIVRSDQPINLRLDNQSDAGIMLNAGGVVLILDATIDAGAGPNNAKLNNNSGATANIRGIAGGT